MNAVWFRFLPETLRLRLAGRTSAQQIIGNMSWLFADRVVRMALSLVVGALVTRYLGPERFGALSYGIALTGLVASLGTLGLDGIVVRDLVRAPERASETMGTAFALKVIGGVATVALSLAIVRALRPDDSTALAIVAIVSAGTIAQSLDTIDFWFQSQVAAKYVVYARGAAFALMAALRLWLIHVEASLVAFAWATLVELTLAGALLLVAYEMRGERLMRWRASLARANELLADSWPLVVSGLAIGVYMRIDTLMLADMLSDDAAGVYSAAVRISEVWYFIPVAITASVAPSITAAKATGDALYYARLQRLFRLLAAAALAVAVPLTLAASPIVHLLYGATYAAAGPVLAVHVWGAVFVFLGIGQGCWTVNEGLTTITLPRTIAGAVLNVLLNVFLIPGFGALGAAVATVVSYAAAAVLLNAFERRTRHIFRLQVEAIFLKGVLWGRS